MLFAIIGRGWMSSDDTGTNTSYYLYTGDWYRMISPNYMKVIDHVSMFFIDVDGCIYVGWEYGVGGVRILELCLEI